MNILIVINGRICDLVFLKKQIEMNDYIICTDGAVSYLRKINQVPHLLLGDFDSISSDDLAWIRGKSGKIDSYPRRKDQTDSELAVEKAIALQPKSITLMGGVGSRLDHSLANIMLLYKILQAGIVGRMIDEKNEVIAIQSTMDLGGEIGQTISLVPISEEVKGVSLFGFEYPLTEATIIKGSTLGISNVLKQRQARIEICEGSMFVIRTNAE